MKNAFGSEVPANLLKSSRTRFIRPRHISKEIFLKVIFITSKSTMGQMRFSQRMRGKAALRPLSPNKYSHISPQSVIYIAKLRLLFIS